MRAAQYGVRVAGSPSAAVGLLHGPVASYELPHIFEAVSYTHLDVYKRQGLEGARPGVL